MANHRQIFVLTTLIAVIVLAATVYVVQSSTDEWRSQRAQMIDEIRADVERTAPFTRRTALSSDVLSVMQRVPRHQFVPDVVEIFAYLNQPLPIGSSQTISQPFIVALMTDVIAPESHHKVLEIGTGSGYQAAVLSELVKEVHSVEIIPSLAESARSRLSELGYDNVNVYTADGFDGWPEAAPYDGIIVTAAIERVPTPLVEQLKPGGRLIIPIGVDQGAQELILFEKTADGDLQQQSILPVKFVPFSGEKGEASER